MNIFSEEIPNIYDVLSETHSPYTSISHITLNTLWQ